VLTLVVLGAVAAPWLLSSGSRGDRELGPGDASFPPLADALAFAQPEPMSPDTATPSLPAPVVNTPVRRPPARTPTARRPSAAPPARARPLPGAPGRLFVSATPWGQLYVDDELVGNTPRAAVPISPGPHRLRVVRDGFQPYEQAIRVAPGQELRVTDIVLQEIKP